MMLAALTGNFGMGKSSVLSAFKDLGATVLDSDRIVAHLLKEKKVIRRIKELLGEEILGPDGQLDKKAAAEKIFGNRELKRALEAFLHPLVLKEINDFISRLKDKGSIVVVEVPLLFEGGYQGMFNKVITVYSTRENALRRLAKAGISREEAIARLKTQLPIRIKRRQSDFTINNNGTRRETRKQIEKIYGLLREGIENEPGNSSRKGPGR